MGPPSIIVPSQFSVNHDVLSSVLERFDVQGSLEVGCENFCAVLAYKFYWASEVVKFRMTTTTLVRKLRMLIGLSSSHPKFQPPNLPQEHSTSTSTMSRIYGFLGGEYSYRLCL